MALVALVRAGVAACALFFVTACAGGPTIAVRHDPVYRAEAHTATIEVTAASKRGVDRIQVLLLTGDLVPCEQNGLSSIFPCRQASYWQTFTCDFGPSAAPKTATCPVTRDLTRLTLLTYRASAVDTGGQTTSTNYITFSGGAPPTGSGAASPVSAYGGPGGTVGPPAGPAADLDAIDEIGLPPPGPKAADVLRPVWLESDTPPAMREPAPISFDMRARIDVAFLPDADWAANTRGFSDATGYVADKVLFLPRYDNPVEGYAADYQTWRRVFSYWVGPAGTSSANLPSECRRQFTGWATAARAVTDGQAVVHDTRFRDCTVMEGVGSYGTVYAGTFRSAYIFVHEGGHFLHCLGDEYPDEGIPVHRSCSEPRNTFVSKVACEETAAAHGFSASWCFQIAASSSWRISRDPVAYNDIMDGAFGSLDLTAPGAYMSTDWYDTADVVIQKRIAACLSGACW